jgi:hypothetical protein
MKINASARYFARIRTIMLGAALAAIFVLEVYLGASEAERIGHTASPQTEVPQSPECQPW